MSRLLRILVLKEGNTYVSLCCEHNIVSQGDTVIHSIDMICEAIKMSFEDDLANNLDPYGRGPSSEDDQKTFDSIVKNGKLIHQNSIFGSIQKAAFFVFVEISGLDVKVTKSELALV